jgi:phospholipid/cholesterol/gamma-HCH transport system substrate-binding protein
LLTEIRRFWLTSTPELAATVEITAKLVTSEGQLAGAKLFQARVPVQSKDGAEAAKALDQAFHTVMLDILKWTQEKVAAAAPKKPGPKSHA